MAPQGSKTMKLGYSDCAVAPFCLFQDLPHYRMFLRNRQTHMHMVQTKSAFDDIYAQIFTQLLQYCPKFLA